MSQSGHVKIPNKKISNGSRSDVFFLSRLYNGQMLGSMIGGSKKDANDF